ncbi:MAG: glycogen debranching protein [Cytophagales bacterium]|nr:MAG: glycogen debranching protein [Cytophagales bacterium]
MYFFTVKLEINSSLTLNNYTKASRIEWIETNGLGGYSSCSISGANTRRYHGLFVPSYHPPVGRKVLLSKLEDTIVYGGNKIILPASEFPNYIYDKGLAHLSKFSKEFFPTFHYQIEDIEIKKTIAMIHEQDTLVITYEVLSAVHSFQLELKPLIAFRDFHSLIKANDHISKSPIFGEETLTLYPYGMHEPLYIYAKNSSFKFAPEWCYNFEYKIEQERGLDFQEDLFQYGSFINHLKSGDKLVVIISNKPIEDKDGFRLLKEEKKRREALIDNLPIKDDFTKNLALAADQFLVKRGDLKTIIAGYHWFSDWGRDTMIALPGICLVTGRLSEAKKIIQAFAKSVDMGMIPNRFPDEGEVPEYNTVDATLWYFVAIKKYYDYSNDKTFVTEEILPVLEEIIAWHYRGTRYHIQVDSDELIYAGQRGVQLTWMDAKVGDWVVTPRQGKAIEINALWYNALMIMSDFYALKKETNQEQLYKSRAEKVRESFHDVFVNKEFNTLYDFVDGDFKNIDIRPNQIFAISLPYAIIADELAKNVLIEVEENLLTPHGLRSLAKNNYQFIGKYQGGQLERDGAYHQGTVWSWLIGPYITAKVKIEGNAGRKQMLGYIQKLENNLLEAGVGTISEIFDGDEPYLPNGCIAQAWGVAELLRAYIEDIYPQLPTKLKK